MNGRFVPQPGHPTSCLNNKANGWFADMFTTAGIHQPYIVNFGRTAGLRNLWPFMRSAPSVSLDSFQTFHKKCPRSAGAFFEVRFFWTAYPTRTQFWLEHNNPPATQPRSRRALPLTSILPM